MHDPVDPKGRGTFSSLGFNQGAVQSPIRLVEGSRFNERRGVRFPHRMIEFMYRKQGFLDKCFLMCLHYRHLLAVIIGIDQLSKYVVAKENRRRKETPP